MYVNIWPKLHPKQAIPSCICLSFALSSQPFIFLAKITGCQRCLVTIRRSVVKVKVCAWISQHSGISQPSTLSLLISFETRDCHHMPFPYSPSSSSSNYSPLLLLSSIFSLPFLVSPSSSGLLIVGGGGAWNSAEFWPTLSCQPPKLHQTPWHPLTWTGGGPGGWLFYDWTRRRFSEEGQRQKKELCLFEQMLLAIT